MEALCPGPVCASLWPACGAGGVASGVVRVLCCLSVLLAGSEQGGGHGLGARLPAVFVSEGFHDEYQRRARDGLPLMG